MIIFADSRDPIFNSRDPNRDPKTPFKNLVEGSLLKNIADAQGL